MCLHRLHERASPWVKRVALTSWRSCLIGSRASKSKPLPQRSLEIEFPSHGPLGDRSNAFPDPCNSRQFIDAFLGDHGRVHVRDEKPLSSTLGRQHSNVDRLTGKCVLEPFRGN